VRDIFALDLALQKRGLSESTRANYTKAARKIFDYAVFVRAIPVPPFKLAPRSSLPTCATTRAHREWSDADVRALIGAAHKLDERDAAIADFYGLAVELLVTSGARISELLGSTYEDFDYAEAVWILASALKRGGGRGPLKTKASERRIPLPPALVRRIAERKLKTGSSDSDYAFASGRGAQPISVSNFRRRCWDRAVKDAGLDDGPRVTPHDGRHMVASLVARAAPAFSAGTPRSVLCKRRELSHVTGPAAAQQTVTLESARRGPFCPRRASSIEDLSGLRPVHGGACRGVVVTRIRVLFTSAHVCRIGERARCCRGDDDRDAGARPVCEVPDAARNRPALGLGVRHR
jgi:integrase